MSKVIRDAKLVLTGKYEEEEYKRFIAPYIIGDKILQKYLTPFLLVIGFVLLSGIIK